MVSIRNREHLHEIVSDDWSDVVVDELPKTYEEVLTFYTTVTLKQDELPEKVKPAKPIIPTYNIKERTFKEALPAGWTQTAPAAQTGVARYFCTAYVTSTTWEVEVDNELSDVGVYMDEGGKTADVVLYQRPVVKNLIPTTPTTPNGIYTYTFSTKNIVGSGETNGWSVTEPEANGYPLWVVKARATGYTDTITVSGWSDPIIEIDTAVNTAEITLYQLADEAPAVPTEELTYTFADKAFSGSLNGWSTSVPARDTDEKKRQACFVTSAIAVSNYPYDIIQTGEWTTPVVDTENAADEYLEVIPKRIVGKYEYNEATEGFELVYYPSIIDVEAYRVVGSADPLKITSTRYFKYFLDEDTKGNKIEAGKNFSISGALNTVTICAYSDENCTNKTATETVSIVSDSRSIYRILKRWLITNKESGIDKTNILATDGGTNEVAGWRKQEDGSPDSVTGAQPYMWAYDRIEYTDGSYQTTDPIRLTSSASYTLSLSNDADIVAISNQTDAPVGELPTVVVSRWVGDLSKDTESLGVVTCDTPSGWTEGTHYSFGVVDGYYTLAITSIPTSFFKGNFTFVWKETSSATTSLASKTFSLTAVASLVDYEFKFDQTVFNSSHEAGTYSFRVLKKDNTGTTELEPNNADGIEVYCNGVPFTKWGKDMEGVQYNLDETDKRTYVLKDAAGMVWDTEVVEFVNDGEFEEIFTDESQITASYDANGNLVYTPSGINIEVYRHVGQSRTPVNRTIYAEIIMVDGTSNEQEISSGLVLQGDIKAINLKAYNGNVMTCSKTITVSSKTITIKEQTRWYHIGGTVNGITPDPNLFSDPYENDPNKWSQTIAEPTETNPVVWFYDKTVFTDNSVQRTAPVANRSAPYSIVFDNDSASISADAEGTVNTTTLEAVSQVNVTVYHGSEDVTDRCTLSWTSSGGTLSSTNTKSTKFTALSSDTATATVSVHYGLDFIGSRAFTISKSKQAATYKLSAEPNSWNKTETVNCTPVLSITKYGAGDPQTFVYEFNNTSDIYVVKADGSDWDGGAISSTTIFELYVNGEKVDSETVTSTNGVQSIVNWYKAHNSKTEAPEGSGTDGGWTTTTPSLDASTNKYLWGYEVITYSSDNVSTTAKHFITAYGDTGVHGAEAEAVRVFCQRLNTSSYIGTPPSNPDEIKDIEAVGTVYWTTWELSASSDFPIVYTSTGIKSTVYDEAGNGTTTYGEWTTPELWDAYLNEHVNGDRYATYMKLLGENNSENGFYYDDNGNMYINATLLDAKTLLVKDGNNDVVFSADESTYTVYLAGWTVSRIYGIYSNGYKVGIIDPVVGSSNFSRTSLISGNSKIVYYAGSFDPTGTASENYTKIPEFAVLADGSLYATAAKISGNITATSGKIGGSTYYWTIDSYGMYQNRTSGQYTGMMSNGRKVLSDDKDETDQGYVKFYAGGSKTMKDTGQDAVKASTLANFVVTDKGYTYIKKLHVDGDGYFGADCSFRGDITEAGTVNAKSFDGETLSVSGTGSIGDLFADRLLVAPQLNLQSTQGTVLLYPQLYQVSAQAVTAHFDVDVKTDILNASMNILNFAVEADRELNEDTVVYVYVTTSQGRKVGTNITIKEGTKSGIGSTKISATSMYALPASCSPSSKTWYVGGSQYRGLTISTGRIYTHAGEFEILFNQNKTFRLTHRKEPTSATSDAFLQCWYDPAASGDQNETGLCASFYHQLDDSGNKKFFIYSWKEPLNLGSSKGGVLYGTWSGKVTEGSDARLKVDIHNIQDNYQSFYDKLIPRGYKYLKPIDENTGYRFGFIAQEVLNALEESGLPTDWAAVQTDMTTDYLSLAYTEFIALNTWQIQKLKPRMTAAEQEIASLKLEIQRLRAELEALK